MVFFNNLTHPQTNSYLNYFWCTPLAASNCYIFYYTYHTLWVGYKRIDIMVSYEILLFLLVNDDDRVAVVVVLLLMVRMAIDINHRLWWNVYIHITYSIYVYVLNLLHACHRHSTEFTRRFIVQWLIKSATQSDCGCLAIHSRSVTGSFVQFSYEYSLYNMPMANPL